MVGHVDVVVVGGGIAGTATAIHLQRLGLKVSLWERLVRVASPSGEHASPLAAFLLRQLVPEVSAFGVETRGIVSRWGAPDARFHDYFFNPYGCGLSLDRASLAEHLLHEARRAGVRVECDARVMSIQRAAGSWNVVVAVARRQKRVSCAFLVDATGRASWIARRAGATRRRYDQLISVAAWLEGESRSEMNVLRIEAAPTGWAYLAEIPGGRQVATFLTDSDLRPPGGVLAAWASLMQTVPGLHDEITEKRPEGFRVFPADLSMLDCGISDGWAAVGDAFCTQDPLSGSGIAMALMDAAGIAGAVCAAISGNDAPLRAHEAVRRATFESNLAVRTNVFAQETRWSGELFWRRRAGIEAPDSQYPIAQPSSSHSVAPL
jgi:flavin-dependent dehydrogenase